MKELTPIHRSIRPSHAAHLQAICHRQSQNDRADNGPAPDPRTASPATGEHSLNRMQSFLDRLLGHREGRR